MPSIAPLQNGHNGQDNKNNKNDGQDDRCEERSQVRSEILELHAKRHQLEAEIRQHMQTLLSHGVGMHDDLLDDEGFPRVDLDIPSVRHARNRIICLNNDIRDLMREIEEKISSYFA